MKKALITGVTGQDGSYLAEFLLSKGYEVHGIIRRSSNFNTNRIEHIFRDPHVPSNLHLVYGDSTDSSTLNNIIKKINPEEVYNLAAQSHVKVSFETPEYSSNVVALGALRILEAIKEEKVETKFYQASSSEMFGSSPPPQNEETPFRPASPYAASKLYSYWITKIYREGYDIFASNGILFNHESPRRGETFVTRKITTGIAKIVAKKQDKLYLGNLNAMRDWGFAPEYIESMWEILNQKKPDDFVIGTGEAHSVKEFVIKAFQYVGLDWEKYVVIDPRYFRPIEPENLISDSQKAKKTFNWDPKITFNDLVKIMIDADMKSIGIKPRGEGFEILEKKFPKIWWLRDSA